jgi:hypothetical protein
VRLNAYAVSPVVSTVIILAIAIAVAIAVTLWIAGVSGTYAKVETIQVVNKYASGKMSGGIWIGDITLTVRNSGSFDLSITEILINGRPHTFFGDVDDELPIPLKSGETKTITIKINKGNLSSGAVAEVVLHTSTGTEYYQVVNIPLQLT